MEINYKELFEKSPGLYLILQPDFSIVAVTDAYLKATKTKREDILGRGIFDVFPDNPQDLTSNGVSNLRASLTRVLDTGIIDVMAIQKYDIRKPESEGGGFEERFWSPLNSPVLDENNQVKMIIIRVEDVTNLIKVKQKGLEQEEQNTDLRHLTNKMGLEITQQLKEISEANVALKEANNLLQEKTKELERSNEELGRFAETASHDIKAPFRGVGYNLEIIKRRLQGKIDDPEIVACFESIASARERIAALLDDLLNFAHVSQDKESFVSVNVEKVVRDVLRNLEFKIKKNNAKIIISNDLPNVKGVDSQIFQLFQNLIANAIKFHKNECPEIIISVKAKKGVAAFSIKDNGIGIDEKYFEKIFMVFERLHTQSEYAGTGLGLAICKRIVIRHGGKIWVKSEVGKGTTFYFTLQITN
ncbi:MAG TPA: ATP-binding protein [Bacteroidia bacterium]|jgi:signal transduction histidine kinase